jgi:hypothetical protein
MVKTFGKEEQKLDHALRSYDPEEFEADTTEERPIALLAEKRRQFLSGLKARQTDANPSADK